MNLFRSKWLKLSPFFISLFLILIIMAPVLCSEYTIKWDAYDAGLPIFIWMGSALRQGLFPGHFPYIFNGYPLAGDVQSGVYNPYVILSSFLFPNSTYVLNFLYLLIQLTTFVNFYYIGLFLFKDRWVSSFFSVSILFSGFMIGHSEHFTFTIVVVAFSLCLLSFIQAYKNHFLYSFLLAFFGSIHFTTFSYPTLTISSFICFLLITVYWIPKEKNLRSFLKKMSPILLGLVFGLLYSSSALYYALQTLSLSTRSEPISLDLHLAGSQHPTSLLNLLFPFLIYSKGIDISMDQFHLLLISPLLLITLLVKIYRGEWRQLGIAKRTGIWCGTALLIFVLLNLGKYSPIPLRPLLAQWSPFRMGRFPGSNFNFQALILLAFFSARTLQYLFQRWSWTPSMKFLFLILIFFDAHWIYSSKRNLIYFKPHPKVPVQSLKVIYQPHDQKLLDENKYCPPVQSNQPIYIDTNNDLLFAGYFKASGYSPLYFQDYVNHFNELRWALCQPGRLWRVEDKKRVHYQLISYSPRQIELIMNLSKGAHVDDLYLWSEVNTGYWTLYINDQETPFVRGVGALRYFRIPQKFINEDKIHIRMRYNIHFFSFHKNSLRD